MQNNNVNQIYRNRFSKKDLISKNGIWKVLCKFFRKLIISNLHKEDFSILDLGAGYCEFINNISTSGKRTAVDFNPDIFHFVSKDVNAVCSSVLDITCTISEKYDAVFVSNLFEHFNSSEELLKCMNEIHSILSPHGLLIVLQPNIDLCGSRYWDFIDHKLPVNIPRMKEASELCNFKTLKIIPRFLPYTTQSRLPKWGWLIHCYLWLLPFSGWLFGKQSLFVFTPENKS